jgi:hypothetical protein
VGWETEWFALPAFRHAVEILKTIPGLNGPPVSALQTLEGKPWLEQAFEPDPMSSSSGHAGLQPGAVR